MLVSVLGFRLGVGIKTVILSRGLLRVPEIDASAAVGSEGGCILVPPRLPSIVRHLCVCTDFLFCDGAFMARSKMLDLDWSWMLACLFRCH